MTDTAELELFYSDIEKAAGLLDVTCSREKVWPILTAYGPQTHVAFRVATNGKGLDCRFASLPENVDPYAMALSNGLTEKTDHPVGTLLADIQERLTVDHHGIDFSVVDGFKKTWTFFPLTDLEKLSRIAELPSMPSSLAGNMEFYSRYGLADKVSLIGIDYANRTVNVYFLGWPDSCREPETVRSMLRDLGLPEPSAEMLKLAGQATGIYTTLSWDSPKVHRLTFGVVVPDLGKLSELTPIGPAVEKFATSAPIRYDAARTGIYGVTAAEHGEYHKLQAWYMLPPHMLKLLTPGAGRPGAGT